MAEMMVARPVTMPRETLQVSSCFPNPLPLPGEKNCLVYPAHQREMTDMWSRAGPDEPNLG